MNTRSFLRLLSLAGALALAACDGSAADPFSDEALAEEDQIALSLLADASSIETALSLADVPLSGSMGGRMGMGMRSGAAGDASQARIRFQAARQALTLGDSARAAALAREARVLVGRAALAAGGRGAALGMVERMRGLALAVGHSPGDYHDAAGLQQQLEHMAERARLGLHRGDTLGAAQRGVLAEQHHRQRERDPQLRPGGVVVSVELADAAVALATRLLTEAGASEEQTALLELAADYAEVARSTLEAGVFRMVGHLGSLSQWMALRAVVGPDGASDEEAQAILALAQELYAQASALADLDDVEKAVLARAAGQLEGGAAALADGSPHAVYLLWRAAVVCSWLLA